MDKNQQNELNTIPLEQQLETQIAQMPAEPKAEQKYAEIPAAGLKEKPRSSDTAADSRTLGIGDWMITLLFFLLPIVNIIVMAIWAFSSRGNIHRRNFSRACLLWIIILLLGYVVAMTVAGYTIFDIFTGSL